MSGVLWATASGIGFGLFQSLNRRAIRGIKLVAAVLVAFATWYRLLALARPTWPWCSPPT